MSDLPKPTRGVPVEIEGTEYRLRVSLATRKEIIKLVGGEEKLKKMNGGEHLGPILLLAMRENHPDMTLETLEDMIDLENLSDVVTALSKAMGMKEKPLKVVASGESEAATGN